MRCKGFVVLTSQFTMTTAKQMKSSDLSLCVLINDVFDVFKKFALYSTEIVEYILVLVLE